MHYSFAGMELLIEAKTCIGRIHTPGGCDFYMGNHGCNVKYGLDAAGICFINTLCLCYYKCPPPRPMNIDAGKYGASPLASAAP